MASDFCITRPTKQGTLRDGLRGLLLFQGLVCMNLDAWWMAVNTTLDRFIVQPSLELRLVCPSILSRIGNTGRSLLGKGEPVSGGPHISVHPVLCMARISYCVDRVGEVYWCLTSEPTMGQPSQAVATLHTW